MKKNIEWTPELPAECDKCSCSFTSTGHCSLFDDAEKIRWQTMLEFHDAHHTGHLNRILGTGNGSNFHEYRISNEETCQYLTLICS